MRMGSGQSGMLDGWPWKRLGMRLPSLSRAGPSPAGGDGAGVARPPWTQEPLALPGLSWWARILTTATATVVSTVVSTAGVATRVAGVSGNMKGAPVCRVPLSALPVGRGYPVMRSR